MPHNRRHTDWAACREFRDAPEDHFSDFCCLLTSSICHSAAAVSCYSRLCFLGAPRARLHTGASRSGKLPALLQLAPHSLHGTRCSSRTARHLLPVTRCPPLAAQLPLLATHSLAARCPAPASCSSPTARHMLPVPGCQHPLLATNSLAVLAIHACSSISAVTPFATDCCSLRCRGSVAIGLLWQSW